VLTVRQAVSSHNPLVLILGFGALFFALGLFSLGGFVQLIWSDWAGFPAGHYSELFGTSTGLFSLTLIMAGFDLYTGLDLRMLAWPVAFMGMLPYAYTQGSGRWTLASLGAVVLVVMALAALVTGLLAFYGHIAEVVRQQAR
jgi:putative membrane protein